MDPEHARSPWSTATATTIDGFADIVVVNYEILDRHVGWLGELGFRGMVVDEAHFIKNKSSQRSQHVLQLSDEDPRPDRPAAAHGADRHPADQRHRGLPRDLAVPRLDRRQEAAGDADGRAGGDRADARPTRAFYPARPQRVVDMGIVRRRKVDVAADIPARRVADLPVELDDEAGRSIRAGRARAGQPAGGALRRRAARRHRRRPAVEGIDHELVRRVAAWEREDAQDAETGENVFAMMRRIGQAKAGLAADYAAQLARNVGKVVFFAKHIDVMDTAEEMFAQRGHPLLPRSAATRAPRCARRTIDAFVNDPDVAVVVCSLTAAGVGLNLQVASNLVLAELSWTDAEQTQAIDRIHRIGQAEPVTAWRIIAAQTIDARIAELIDGKAGLAARALDGSDEEVGSSADVQLEALVALLTDALERRESGPAVLRPAVLGPAVLRCAGLRRPLGVRWRAWRTSPLTRPASTRSSGRPSTSCGRCRPSGCAAPCGTPTRTSPHYRRPRRGRRAPRRRARAGRPGAVAVHRQGGPAGELPVRHVRGAARAGGAGARLVGDDRQAHRRRVHRRRRRMWASVVARSHPRGRGATGRRGAHRLRVRPVHRRPGGALRAPRGSAAPSCPSPAG